MKLVATLLIFLSGYLINGSYGFSCEEESLFGITTHKSCPGPLDSSEDVFCCGTKRLRYCCDSILGLNDNDIEELAEKLPSILAIIFGVAISLIILCVVCCCCCPFCFCYKKRQRGVVHNPAPAPTNMQVVLPPNQQSYIPVQTGAPQQHPYPQQGYAPQPQSGAPYPTPSAGAPYPTPSAGAPYPTSTQQYPSPYGGNDNPPPYNEKQMAFNPNY